MNAPLSRFDTGDRIAFAPPPALEAQPQLGIVQQRLMVLMLLFMLVTGVIAARLVQICLFGGDDGRRHVAAPSFDLPDMVDRNGVRLATGINTWVIAVNPQKINGDREAIAEKLAALLPERDYAYYRRILFSKRKFVYLRRPATPELAMQVNAIGDPGLMLLREQRRLYPQAQLAGHVLGYIDRDGVAQAGMEKVLQQRIAKGAHFDGPVSLSIDSRVQAALESELNAAMVKFSAVGASGVVLDIKTGELLALTSLPSFNPNAPGRDVLNAANKATYFTYELGSTFKMLTVANAMETGVVRNMAQRYDATGALHVGGFSIHDDHPKGRWLTIPEVLVYSSNIGTARMADDIGVDRAVSFFKKLGFDQPTDIELFERGKPQFPSFWARTTLMTTAYGHGIAVTPLHLAQAYAALANDGIWHPVTLLKHKPGAPLESRRIVSQATSWRVRQLMRLVVLQGTGGNADAPGLRVGGKTGTAEKLEGGRYSKRANLTAFSAVFPLDQPRYVVVTMLDDPKATKETFGFKTAGWNVAPVEKKVISRIGPLLGIRPDMTKDIDVSDLMPLIMEKKVPGKNEIE
ncbi:penicillin-binding protein 2 [uncultured Sphingomonas sp.]|uniref:peptidoglycan D,D-transpeptidase FtsI family protein n=1 Tax=uncultured Sphingomonas sp. TaxID=158754 RepID=UPI0025E2E3F2|nr:penicillin-binding protein 2 [uncultured Sphingomonas sp.]